MTRIILSIFYVLFYVIWLLWRDYGWVFFFGFEALIIGVVLLSHSYFKKASKIFKEAHPYIFQNERYWKLLQRYGVAIYTPLAAENIAISFTVMCISGCVVGIIMLIMLRYVEGLICLANAFLASRIAAWLDPIFFLTEAAKKDPRYANKANAILGLRSLVRQMHI